LNEQNKKSFQKKKFLSAINTSFGLGFSISLPIAGGAVLGFMIDNKFGSHPRWTLSLLFTGIFIAGGAIYQAIKETKKE
jgi:F0F1-type ATP synthase assembly protein I